MHHVSLCSKSLGLKRVGAFGSRAKLHDALCCQRGRPQGLFPWRCLSLVGGSVASGTPKPSSLSFDSTSRCEVWPGRGAGPPGGRWALDVTFPRKVLGKLERSDIGGHGQAGIQDPRWAIRAMGSILGDGESGSGRSGRAGRTQLIRLKV